MKPREGKMVLSGDGSGRRIEAGLLYGRLSLLEEQQGHHARARSEMARGVSLLKSAGHPEPTEAHIREAIAAQDARRER
jgi:hypothetical protein